MLTQTENQNHVQGQAEHTKNVHFETWGCQMNIADSEAMLAQLKSQNYRLVHNANDADLIVLNTCHIREKARHKVMSRLGELRELKEEKPKLKIAVTGCVAQAEGKSIAEKADFVDVVLGPGKISEFIDTIKKNEENAKQQINLGFPRDNHHKPPHSESTQLQPVSGKFEVARYVNIMAGCNNYCTFCVVPYTRGREISRTKSEILNETELLVKQGAKEIQLLGQNVNSYGHDLIESGLITDRNKENIFPDLLVSVANIPGVERLRFTTSNPHDFSYELAKLFKTEPKLGKYLHLPVQSGSNSILESMKRKLTREQYLERVAWLRSFVPDMALSTDIIVGFPGECDEDFEATMDLIKTIKYSFVFAFKYSPRKNTAAARFRDQIDEDIKSKRLNHLNTVQDLITLEQQQLQIGTVQETLFVYEKNSEPGFFYGRTPQYRAVRVYSQHDIVGRILPVEIVGASKTTLQGKLV